MAWLIHTPDVLRRTVLILICCVFFVFFMEFFTTAVAVAGSAALRIGAFSRAMPGDEFPPGWEPLTFEKNDRKTRYILVKDDGKTVVRAESNDAASGMIRKIRIDPEAFPVIQWRWKVTRVFESGDVTQKAGDDAPVRVYVSFEYDPDRSGFFRGAKYRAVKALRGEYPPLCALTYIWASTVPKGKIMPNPHTDRAMVFVLESGPEKTGGWINESRNILSDFKKAFPDEWERGIPMISGVAVMTDTDATGEEAVSFYGDILFQMK